LRPSSTNTPANASARWSSARHGDDLSDELDRLAAVRAYPAVLRRDNGPELSRAAMADWARKRVGMHRIPPGQPWRNGYLASFNLDARRLGGLGVLKGRAAHRRRRRPGSTNT
jgi:hypothetical protein